MLEHQSYSSKNIICLINVTYLFLTPVINSYQSFFRLVYFWLCSLCILIAMLYRTYICFYSWFLYVTGISLSLPVCVSVCLSVYLSVYVYVCVCVCLVHITHVHTHTHKYIYTYIYIYAGVLMIFFYHDTIIGRKNSLFIF